MKRHILGMIIVLCLLFVAANGWAQTNLTVVRHSDNTLWKMTCDGTGSCSAWTQISGASSSTQPTLTWDPSIQKYILMARGGSSTLYRGTFDADGAWNNDWTQITGTTASPVAVAAGSFLGSGSITASLLADGAVTASKLGIACPDGQYLQFTVANGWVCSAGTPGPQGPEGPVGPQGPQGLTGPAGPMPHYAKVAVVAQSGGDYTDPVAAMNDLATWCGTPSSANPCLLKIMPGRYDLSVNALTMSEFVDLEGSGVNTTILYRESADTVVAGAGNSEIRNITIENGGGGPRHIARVLGYYSLAPSCLIRNVRLKSTGGSSVSSAIGLELDGCQTGIVDGLDIISGGTAAKYGVYLRRNTGSIAFDDVAIRGVNHAFYAESCSGEITMSNMSANVDADPQTNRGTESNFGVLNSQCTLTMKNSRVTSNVQAIQNDYMGTLRIFHSELSAPNALQNYSTTTAIMSQIDGAVGSPMGSLNCLNLYSSSLAQVTCQ